MGVLNYPAYQSPNYSYQNLDQNPSSDYDTSSTNDQHGARTFYELMSAFPSISSSNHGFGGIPPCKDDNLYELMAVGISLFALFQSLMTSNARRKRRKREDLDNLYGSLSASDMLLDIVHHWSETSKENFSYFVSPSERPDF